MHIPPFEAARVLVAGDAMLDRYWYGDTSRVSPEAPVPVVQVGDSADRAGGAANVAAGLKALGASAAVLAPVGDDAAGETLAGLVRAAGAQWHASPSPGLRTTTKLRVISRHQQMLRLDFEDAPESAAAIEVTRLEPLLDDVDALVLSDYGKGALRDPGTLIAAARARGLPVLVDPKRADLHAYRGATVITPNRGEFERAVGACRDSAELAARGQELIERLSLQALVVTRGEDGMMLLQKRADAVHIPAEAHEVFDVTGAGDTVVATLAAALSVGVDLAQAAAIANLAAGVAVGKLGTATVGAHELRLAAAGRTPSGGSERGVVTEAELLERLAAARARCERVVFTNGCFDLLHPGHIAYLQAARALGDRLVVAVNDDASVRRLKGPGRPVNRLDDRMAVLAALSSVDWVVAFGEDTPARLVESAAPQVLAKGGDYRPEQVAGFEAVRARGGEVHILPFVDGHSSTAVIERLRRRE